MKADKHLLTEQTQPSCLGAVRSRFFAQYWGTKTLYVGGIGLQEIGNGGWNLKHPDFFLKLKPLSKITNEDAEKLQYTLVNVVGLDGLIRQNSIELVKEVVLNYEQIDCLFMLPTSFADLARELGYAIDWNSYKVSKQVELGWVQLL